MVVQRPDHQRIVITGIGLTAPNGNNLSEFRASLAGGAQRRAAVRGALLRPNGGGRVQLR